MEQNDRQHRDGAQAIDVTAISQHAGPATAAGRAARGAFASASGGVKSWQGPEGNMANPNGIHHLAIMTSDVKSQTAFCPTFSA